jgi:hypothetical protein
MTAARAGHTATLLGDGRVLIAGGSPPGCPTQCLETAELYDPATGVFTATESMATRRRGHTATLLDDGRVLIAGGWAGDVNVASTELFDPATGMFTPGGSMTSPHSLHTATTLNDGMVLMAAGVDWFGTCASTELYDPATGAFTASSSMNRPREGHTATLLSSGKVLMTGGWIGGFLPSAELYDPSTRTFTAIGSMSGPRTSHTATLLDDGQVLVGGGSGFEYSWSPNAGAELFAPASSTPPDLESIDVSPGDPTIMVGGMQKFVATGTFSDGTTKALASVIWSSSSESIAEMTNDVTNKGTAVVRAAGTAVITASAGDVSGSTTLTVPAEAAP